MGPARRAVADQLLSASRAHDSAQDDRLARFRNLEPDTAALLALLVRATNAQAILEVGSSNGYSTIWLADAAEATGGRFTSLEIDPARTAMAADSLARAGLSAELLSSDAAEVLRDSPEEAWDFIFLDSERSDYAAYWPRLLRVLRPGGLLAVDNVLSHPGEVRAFTALVEAEGSVHTTVIPCGAGLRLILREAAG